MTIDLWANDKPTVSTSCCRLRYVLQKTCCDLKYFFTQRYHHSLKRVQKKCNHLKMFALRWSYIFTAFCKIKRRISKNFDEAQLRFAFNGASTVIFPNLILQDREGTKHLSDKYACPRCLWSRKVCNIFLFNYLSKIFHRLCRPTTARHFHLKRTGHVTLYFMLADG